MQEELKVIYNLLKDKNYHTADEISDLLGVSTKTTRKQIKELKNILKPYNIQVYSKTSRGYILEGEVLKEKEIFKNNKNLIDTSEKRIEYLMYKLIDSDKYIKIEDLSKELYVSTKTISLDLKILEEKINKYNLLLDRKPYYGVKINGLEKDIRNFLVELLNCWLNENKNIKVIKEFLKSNNSEELYKYFNNKKIKISDLSFQSLLLSIFVTINRVKKNKNICKLDIKEDKLFLEKKEIIVDFINKYFKEEKLSDNDINYMTIRFLIAETLNYSNISNNVLEIKEIINEILKYMNLTFQINLFDNEELYKNLYTHLLALGIRIRFDIPIVNPLLNDIVENMRFEYNIALYLAKILENRYNKKIPDEEIAYLAVILHMGIETDKQKIKKKNILIVCPSGRGISKFLIYTYNNIFSKYTNSVTSCGINELLEMDLSNIDIIFTLVDINLDINKPIYKINYFLNEKDISRIKSILKDDKKKIKNIIPENLYIYIDEKKSKEEIISIMSDKLLKIKNIPKNIYNMFLERENLGMTEISNDIAIPHSIKVIENVNVMGVVVTKNKIRWQKNDVNIILFMCLDNKNNNNEFIYKGILKLAEDENVIKEIVKDGIYDKFINKIKEKIDEL